MTGEMSESEVTRENFPVHFAAADKVAGATVEPFDQYQGPYIYVPGKGRYFLISDDGAKGNWWSESTNEVSVSFFCGCSDDVPAEAFRDLVENGGEKIKHESKSLEDLSEEWQVHSPGEWENDEGPKGWYAVSDVYGIVAYFANGVAAHRFRLAEVNRELNDA